jgi:PPM family protein phosphatase
VIDDAIAEMLVHFPDPQQAAEELVRLANHNGGHDNISVVVVDVIDGAYNQPPTAQTLLDEAGDPTTGPTTGSTRAVPHLPQQLVIEPGPNAPAHPPRLQPVTTKRVWANRLRAAVFAIVLIGIVGTVIGGVRFYGTAGTYVGFQDEQVTIFKGRAGGVLWVHPTVLRKSTLTRAKLSQAAFDTVDKTVSFTDQAAAQAWIDALSANPTLAPGNMPATTTTAATTTTTTTTVAPTTTTSTTLPGP